ncbi:ATP-binding protein [Azoarcus olearius]|uniref:histidine kinase n=1 Tax=Azoarcus sp. (strain BH72) TaxID=418699 RepID=A1K225_AZOSB|nr:ATP-binding protein [Azoarcus olearius]CAL92880.1 probable two-component system histidine kinase [Azoarcus olearius]
MSADALPLPGWSLKRRLLGLLLLVAGGVSALTIVLAYRAAHTEAEHAFDAQLVVVAETLMAIAADAGVDYAEHELSEHAYPDTLPVAYQVWGRQDGRVSLLLRSASAPATAMTVHEGLSDGERDGRRWRHYLLRRGDFAVIAGQDHAGRDALARELTLRILLPFLLALPLLAAAIWLTVGRALQPVAALAAEVEAMKPDGLNPVGLADPPPQEIAPLLQALNRLIGRMAAALAGEQRFTADAAHELRTPLAALRIQAQVAARAGEDSAARERALDQVIAGVDRMTHLVDQLLTLARLEPAAAQPAFAPVDLAAVAEAAVAALAPRSAARKQHVECALAPATVSGNAVWLGILARNLIDNALRYAPPGSHIRVRTAREGMRCVLEVSDDGPGLEPGARDSLRARFARGVAADGEGCGLGLSIVGRIVELHGGEFRLGDGLPRSAPAGVGLAATVVLAAASPSPR